MVRKVGALFPGLKKNEWVVSIDLDIEAYDKLIEQTKQYKRDVSVRRVETREMKKRKLEERQERDRWLKLS